MGIGRAARPVGAGGEQRFETVARRAAERCRCAGAAPASCEITASQRRFLQCVEIIPDIEEGSPAIAATAPQWPANISISAGAERVLVVTAMAPSSAQANQARTASMQLSQT